MQLLFLTTPLGPEHENIKTSVIHQETNVQIKSSGCIGGTLSAERTVEYTLQYSQQTK